MQKLRHHIYLLVDSLNSHQSSLKPLRGPQQMQPQHLLINNGKPQATMTARRER
jgi:hypothetical protein